MRWTLILFCMRNMIARRGHSTPHKHACCKYSINTSVLSQSTHKWYTALQPLTVEAQTFSPVFLSFKVSFTKMYNAITARVQRVLWILWNLSNYSLPFFWYKMKSNPHSLLSATFLFVSSSLLLSFAKKPFLLDFLYRAHLSFMSISMETGVFVTFLHYGTGMTACVVLPLAATGSG